MNDYVGKICPVCKQEIKELDKVTVCPDCGMPHHTDCWEMNRGCSTFGCAQQGSVKEIKSMVTCSKCGVPLDEGQDFCPKCGTPRNAVRKNVCGKCGNELADGQEFCPKCGQKVGLVVDSNVSSAINQFNAGVAQTNAKKKKAPIIVAVAVVIVVLLAIAAVKIAPKIFIDTAGYIEQGDLEKAWSKAKTDADKRMVIDAYLADGDYEEAYAKALTDADKKQILVENIAAVQSAFSADNLKDPSSFSLRDAYYREDKNDDGDPIKHLVLYISGANSYGASVSSYWLYTWSNDGKKWEYFCSVSDLSDEEYSKYDDEDEMLEKLLNNIGRDYIKQAMKATKLDKEGVKRINKLFEDDKLDRVKFISAAK
jgi:predicted amidophosphoribosyltransferase